MEKVESQCYLMIRLRARDFYEVIITITGKKSKANRSFSLSCNKKNKLKTIQWKKLRNWDVIEDKKIRHFSKF